MQTMMKISDLLQMTCPTNWILGKLITRETEQLSRQNSLTTGETLSTRNDSVIAAPKPSTSSIFNKETSYSIQHLMNASILKICKFCESLLVDNDFIVNASLKDDTTETITSNEDGLVFCSEFCENLFEKSLILKNFHKKKQENLPVCEQRNESLFTTKLVLKWSSNLIKPLKNDAEIELNKSKLMETVKPVSSHDRRICIFCNLVGDHDDNGPSRLLAMDIGKWCHLNCALW